MAENRGLATLARFEFSRSAVFSMSPMFLRARRVANWPERFNSLLIWTAALLVIAAGVARYTRQPSFWLDEAFVAVSLRNYSPRVIFAPLEYQQLFPRLYLFAIATLRGVLGYRIWVLRLLPLLSFVTATVFWAWLLTKRSKIHFVSALIAAILLARATTWIDQAIQLKQYTLDVALALIPFLAGDDLIKDALAAGRRKTVLAALSLPCILSYTYPLALGARMLGWYLSEGRRSGWRMRASACALLAASLTAALVVIWFTDYRFDAQDRAAYLDYWHGCILGSSLRENAASAAALSAKFLWGWHEHQRGALAGIVPLQMLGAYSVIRRLNRRAGSEAGERWGSRSLGGLMLLGGVILASAVASYPICAERLVLFSQVHTQILAIEGALLILSWRWRKAAGVLLFVLAIVLTHHSVEEYEGLVKSEPSENLRPALAAMRPELADMVFVNLCSIAQVRSLPEPLPVSDVVFGFKLKRVQRSADRKAWVLWSHLGAEDCLQELDLVRGQARSWKIVYESAGAGLALAEF